MIFCSEECYDHSGLKELWEAICAISRLSPKRLQARNRKKKYLKTEKGKEQHRQESRRYYDRKKAASALTKQLEDTGCPKLEADAFPSEKSDTPTPLKAIISEPVVVPEGKMLEPTERVPTPARAIPSENELRQAKHCAILKVLFFGEPEPATISSEETIAVPVGVFPRICKALGCNEVVIPRSAKTEKRFCSRDCMNAFRNTFQNLKEAWKATRCPFLKLLGTLFKQL